MGLSFKKLSHAIGSGGLSLLGDKYDPYSSTGLGGQIQGTWDSLSGKDAEDAAKAAAALQESATNRATAENARQFDIGQANLAPWLAAGKTGLGAYQDLMGLGAGGSGAAMSALENSPGYQFRLEQGQKSLDSGLAARGGMGSGRAMTEGVKYNQGFASNEYGNRLNQLAGMSGIGQNTANTMGAMGANFANNQGNLWTNNANAQGAAGIAGANARQSGLLGMANLGASAYGM